MCDGEGCCSRQRDQHVQSPWGKKEREERGRERAPAPGRSREGGREWPQGGEGGGREKAAGGSWWGHRGWAGAWQGEPWLGFGTIPWSLREAKVTVSSSSSTFPVLLCSKAKIWLLLSLLSFWEVIFPTRRKSVLNWHSLLRKYRVRLSSRNGDSAWWDFKTCVPPLMENLMFVFMWKNSEYVTSFASFEWSPNGPPSTEFHPIVNICEYTLVHLLRIYMFLNV